MWGVYTYAQSGATHLQFCLEYIKRDQCFSATLCSTVTGHTVCPFGRSSPMHDQRPWVLHLSSVFSFSVGTKTQTERREMRERKKTRCGLMDCRVEKLRAFLGSFCSLLLSPPTFPSGGIAGAAPERTERTETLAKATPSQAISKKK